MQRRLDVCLFDVQRFGEQIGEYTSGFDLPEFKRNVYEKVSDDEVWLVLQQDLPLLISETRKLLDEEQAKP